MRVFAFLYVAGLSFLLMSCADLKQAREAAVQGHYDSAVEQWQTLAEYGIPEAQFELGKAALLGQGLNRDLHAGVQWLDLAAQSNDPKIVFEVGRLYANGIPGALKPEYKKAWILLARARDLGQNRALVLMADMTEKGQGVTRDSKQAAEMMQKASDLGVGSATHRLARVAMKAGRVVQAIPLFERAFAQGAENAGVTLAQIYFKQGDRDRASILYNQAIAGGATPDPVFASKLAQP